MRFWLSQLDRIAPHSLERSQDSNEAYLLAGAIGHLTIESPIFRQNLGLKTLL